MMKTNKSRQIFFTGVLAVLLASCERFEYSVYETNRKDYPVEATNTYNLTRLQQLPYKDTLHLVFTGDTQRYYDDLKDMVSVINTLPKLDAVFVAGDLVEFALSHEYEWVSKELIKLKAPFMTVIGNHDCLANGQEVYTGIYGPLNYFFTWNDIRFVMHNTNGREFNFNGTVPDLGWMSQAIADTQNYRHTVFMAHIPPFDTDFDKALEPGYVNVIRNSKSPVFVVHGHRHHHTISQPYLDGIWYLNTSSPENRYFAYVKIFMDTNARKKFDCTFVSF
jgi:3',5'-cyclic-AMP phosphodiesterase